MEPGSSETKGGQPRGLGSIALALLGLCLFIISVDRVIDALGSRTDVAHRTVRSRLTCNHCFRGFSPCTRSGRLIAEPDAAGPQDHHRSLALTAWPPRIGWASSSPRSTSRSNAASED
jgi:hypothetical protein